MRSTLAYFFHFRFAQRVSLIKNKAVVNEDKDPYVMITRLKAEMLSLREEIAYLKVAIICTHSFTDVSSF